MVCFFKVLIKLIYGSKVAIEHGQGKILVLIGVVNAYVNCYLLAFDCFLDPLN